MTGLCGVSRPGEHPVPSADTGPAAPSTAPSATGTAGSPAPDSSRSKKTQQQQENPTTPLGEGLNPALRWRCRSCGALSRVLPVRPAPPGNSRDPAPGVLGRSSPGRQGGGCAGAGEPAREPLGSETGTRVQRPLFSTVTMSRFRTFLTINALERFVRGM